MANWERSGGACGTNEGNKGAVRDKMVERFERITGCGTNGRTNAKRYNSAGKTSPSPKVKVPEVREPWTVLSRVVSSAAK